MLDKEFTKFTESGFNQPESYFPQYQITKLASDMYQIYDFTEREASLCSTKETLKTIASLRGGKPLNRELSSKIMGMSDFQTYTVDNSALKITKKASADLDHEPWKLVVAADGNEYFVSADTQEEVEHVEKTAASHMKHVYSIKIQAHNVKEIAKIADMAETSFGAIQGTTQIPQSNVICFDVVSENTPEETQASIQKEVEESGNIYLPETCYSASNSCCPCGCGKHHLLPDAELPAQQTYQEAPEIPEGQFVLILPDTPVTAFASNIYTLKKYASSKYDTYRIYNSDHEIIAEMKKGIELDPSRNTFSDELTAFLNEQLSKQAEGNVEVIGPDGTVKNEGAELQQGDDIVNKETGEVTKVKKVDAAKQQDLRKQARDENETRDVKVSDPTNRVSPFIGHAGVDTELEAVGSDDDNLKEVVPGEKNPDDTKATGDADVKKWKGMREDPSSGKFVVYITETEEHIFDNITDATNFLTKRD